MGSGNPARKARRAVAALAAPAALAGAIPPAAADTLCFTPSPAGLNASAECTVNTVYPNDWAGYASDASERCTSVAGEPAFYPCPQGAAPGTGSPFGFTLSRSAADPYDNFGPLAGTPATLYLWYPCALRGLAAAEFSVTGGLRVLSFTPMNGFLNAGTSTDLLLVSPCVWAPVVAGRFLVEAPVSSPSSSWGRVKSLYRS